MTNAAIALFTCWLAQAPEDNPAGIELFEKSIRPVLAGECYECHSADAKSLKGGLRLDSRAAMRRGGDSGPAVVPGEPSASLLLSALRYKGPEMPPRRQLPAKVIAEFERWIQLGAPDPRHGAAIESERAASRTTPRAGSDARDHWAYQPVVHPDLPQVNDTEWGEAPIDRFILSRLEAAGLKPSPRADARTLIERLYSDLLGMPPSFETVDEFTNDSSPEAITKVVDRLLASPAYAERWARHWLDVARYADTKDLVLVLGQDAIRPFAYTYRDYVVRAFSEDLPYDEFIRDQLAADQTETKGEAWRLAAMGFLTLGRLFDNNAHDIYDDHIDTVTRGLLGLTVSCARCHDHKYDAIPTEDYYSLYGVFASSERPVEEPLIEAATTPDAIKFEKEVAAKRKELTQHIDSQRVALTDQARRRTPDYLTHVATTEPDILETSIFFLSLSPDDLRPQIIARWRRLINARARPDDPVFGPWHDLLRLPEEELKVRARDIVARWQNVPPGTRKGEINPILQRALEKDEIQSRGDVGQLYGSVLANVYLEAQKLKADPTVGGPEEDAAHGNDANGGRNDAHETARRQLLALLTSRESPTHIPKTKTFLYMARVNRGKYHNLLLEIDKMAVKNAAAPARAMVLVDASELYDPRVFVRGNPREPGKRVPRRFLEILTQGRRTPFTRGSGRLELAQAIASRDNPLASRVLVNRVWMHHLGRPLVDTPSDFGVRSDPPTHPELLDYLAARFVDSGWSIKALHREIVLSRTYQQASRDRESCAAVDADNRLLWRAHRRRLDFESMRDTLLSVAGRLDRRLFGRPVDIAADPKNRRRTIYGLVDRQNLPGLFRSFDFAVPDQSVAKRPETTVPQQALFGLNSEFVVTQARALGESVARASGERQASNHGHRKETSRGVTSLYRRILRRDPNAAELNGAMKFIERARRAFDEENRNREDVDTLAPWGQLAQVLLLTNELMFVD